MANEIKNGTQATEKPQVLAIRLREFVLDNPDLLKELADGKKPKIRS